MEKIEKYYNELNNLLLRAKNDGVDIFPFRHEITTDDGVKHEVSHGIVVGINVLEGGEYKEIAT